jgi:hypothetical protein
MRAHPLLLAFGAAMLLAGAGCGHSSSRTGSAFVSGGVEGGPDSKLWGDTRSDADGSHLGCREGRHYSIGVELRNSLDRAVTIVSITEAAGDASRQIHAVSERVRLAPRAKGGLVATYLERWNAQPREHLDVPPRAQIFVQSNFLFSDCKTLPMPPRAYHRATVVGYRTGGTLYRQAVAVSAAQLIVSR